MYSPKNEFQPYFLLHHMWRAGNLRAGSCQVQRNSLWARRMDPFHWQIWCKYNKNEAMPAGISGSAGGIAFRAVTIGLMQVSRLVREILGCIQCGYRAFFHESIASLAMIPTSRHREYVIRGFLSAICSYINILQVRNILL